MKVKDLIEQLKACDPEATVAVEKESAFSDERITGLFKRTVNEVTKSDMHGRYWTKPLDLIVLRSEWIHVPV